MCIVLPPEFSNAVERCRYLLFKCRYKNDDENTYRFMTIVDIVIPKITSAFMIYFSSNSEKVIDAHDAINVNANCVKNVLRSWGYVKSFDYIEPKCYPVQVVKQLPVKYEYMKDVENEYPSIKCYIAPRMVNVNGPARIIMGWYSGDAVVVENLQYFIPTLAPTFPTWKIDIITDSHTFHYGRKPDIPIVFRFSDDLAATPDLKLVTNSANVPPVHNLHLPFLEPNPILRTWRGVNGVIAVDLTKQRLVDFQEVGFQTVPTICGCFICEPDTNSRDHRLLIIVEPMNKVEFLDDRVHVKMVICAGKITEQIVYINTQERSLFNNVLWLPSRTSEPYL